MTTNVIEVDGKKMLVDDRPIKWKGTSVKLREYRAEQIILNKKSKEFKVTQKVVGVTVGVLVVGIGATSVIQAVRNA